MEEQRLRVNLHICERDRLLELFVAEDGSSVLSICGLKARDAQTFLLDLFAQGFESFTG
jgi:hypothetical protein